MWCVVKTATAQEHAASTTFAIYRVPFVVIPMQPQATLIAGSSARGTVDGPRNTARFQEIRAIIEDKKGNIYVSQKEHLHKIDLQGNVSILVRWKDAKTRANGLAYDENNNILYIAGDAQIFALQLPP